MGRFPTCSSPVRHVSLRREHVRLACIRHAASVNPEPGSNSPPKWLPAHPKVRQDFISHCACVISDTPDPPPHPLRSAARPARRSSIFGRPLGAQPPPGPQSLPKGRSSSLPLASHLASNLSRCGAFISARAKENRPNWAGSAWPQRICVSAPIVVDDLQSETLRLLARAQISACQHLLTDADYRHVRTRVSRDFELIHEGISKPVHMPCSGCDITHSRA